MSAPVETSQESQTDFQEEQQIESQGSPEEVAGEAVNELHEQVSDALEEGKSKQEIQKIIKEFELKVNGKTVKKSIDLSNEEEVRKELQKSAAFGDLSQTHSQMVKNLQNKIELWKKNPDLMFQDLELDPLDYAEKRIQKEVEELKKSPEEKKYEEQQRKIMEYEERERRYKEEQDKQKLEQENQQAYEALRGEIREAFEGHEGLKYNEDTERDVADMMARYSEKFPDITASQVIPLVEKELQRKFNVLLESMPDSYIEKFINKNAIERISKKVAKPAPKVPTKKAPPTVTSTQVVSPSSKSVKDGQTANQPKKKSFEDVWR